LGPHAREFHQAALARDIDALRRSVDARPPVSAGWRSGPRRRQALKLLALTY
jgi:hypothetical protein